jgi:hypothetical protein
MILLDSMYSEVVQFRGRLLRFRVLLVLTIACVSAAAESAALLPETILENYCAAERVQERLVKGASSMEVEIEASLPRLKQQGRLHALRRISALGRITYQVLGFEGDGAIKNQVIARYLTAEAEVQKEQPATMAVTPANYKFKYKGRTQLDGRNTYLFQVTPRKKRQGMFRGDLWVDSTTYLRVQESGYLVKNPSIFLKRIAFVRRYEIRNGISVPLQVQSVVDTRLVGKAELTIDFTNFLVEAAGLGDEEQ